MSGREENVHYFDSCEDRRIPCSTIKIYAAPSCGGGYNLHYTGTSDGQDLVELQERAHKENRLEQYFTREDLMQSSVHRIEANPVDGISFSFVLQKQESGSVDEYPPRAASGISFAQNYWWWRYAVVVLFGLVSFAGSFSLTYILCTVLFGIGLHLGGFVNLKDPEDRRRVIGAIGASNVFLWVSLWLSTKDLPSALVNLPIQKAGFPFIAFFYPHPPMGNDMPPFHMWPAFFLNYLFWFMLSYLLVLKMQSSQKITRTFFALCTVSGAALALIGLGYVMMKFD